MYEEDGADTDHGSIMKLLKDFDKATLDGTMIKKTRAMTRRDWIEMNIAANNTTGNGKGTFNQGPRSANSSNPRARIAAARKRNGR